MGRPKSSGQIAFDAKLEKLELKPGEAVLVRCSPMHVDRGDYNAFRDAVRKARRNGLVPETTAFFWMERDIDFETMDRDRLVKFIGELQKYLEKIDGSTPATEDPAG